MAYISKSNILAAYKKLSQMHPDPNAQGATQKISAIRHFLALDSFYKLHNRDCDTRDRNDKEEYANLVGKVCDVCLNWYTTNFYYPLKRHTGDYSVGSNFYSVGQVNASLVNPNEVFDYPRRGNIPLMNVQNGVLKRKVSLYRNLENYITSTDYAVALVVWLIRKISIEQNNGKNLYDNIHFALSEIFTVDLLNVLFKDSTAFEQELNKYNLTFNNNFYSIQENDIENLFDISSPNEEKHIDFPTSHQVIFYGAPGTGKSHKIKRLTKGYEIEIPFGNQDTFENKIKEFFSNKFPSAKNTAGNYVDFILADVHSNIYSNIIGKHCTKISECFTVEDAEKLYNAFKKDGILSGININGVPSAALKNYIEFLDTVPKFKIQKQNKVFRTTFHPDSDYSTFVGAYKPIMKKQYRYEGKVKASYYEDDDLAGAKKGDPVIEKAIEYSFVPQAFLNAYIQAYKKPEEKVYLIIEEINRGNCAQIFGDLFQLLDRDENGISEYTIKADADLKAFLEDELGEDNPGIKDGELCLPSNLYIYATMNTSDQSLFPIDSAFKRRWDWEYEPIKYKNTDWKIVIADTEYSWTSFQRKVNDKILSATSSEDKMLGDYFVNPSDGIITDKVLLNKILFYLWNDVCKDGEGDIFKISETEDVSFSELYGENGTKTLMKMMSYLGITGPEDNKVSVKSDEDVIENQSE